MTYAQRTDHLRPEGAYQVLARAQELEAQGKHIIHLEIGEPDFVTPSHVSLAGIRAIANGQTRYNPPAGMTPLREAIAEYAGRLRGISIKPSQVVVSPGAKPNLFFPTLALVNPGDEVIYPDPGFPTYEAMIGVAGGIPVAVPLLEKNGFSFDLDAFDQLVNPKTKLIILNSPSNPTGGVIPQAHLEHIAAAAIENDCWVLSDEIYNQLVFDNAQAPSIASIPGMLERTIIMDGFSKTYAMTGWRLGYGIMPEGLANRVSLLLTHSIGCTAHFTQIAGIEALTGPQDYVNMMVKEYQRRRDLLVNALNQIPGISCLKPHATFYTFPNIKATGKTSNELANLFLDGGVAVLPGSAFGKYGEGYLRIVFANSYENIEIALERMDKVLRKFA
ncbi:MAG: pyridoxal phosphate-dependent aminotransferase [Anaerolineales bacterium]